MLSRGGLESPPNPQTGKSALLIRHFFPGCIHLPNLPTSGVMKLHCRSFLVYAVVGLTLVSPLCAAPAKKVQLGVSLLALTNPFFRDLGEAMRDEAAKHGMEVVLVSGEFDAARQRDQ